MHFSKTLVATLFAAFAAAQEMSGMDMSMDMSKNASTSTDQAATGTTSGETPSGSVMVHVVKVGGANKELTFEPNDIKAKKGDMIQFQFWPSNHSVVQGSFDKPCQPMDKGFYSGFMAVTTESKEMPVYTMMVEDDTKPMWFYCSQGKHCQGGMVGVINANAEKTLSKYKDSCKGAKENLSPGQSSSGSSGSTGSYSGSSTMSTGVASPTGEAGGSATTSNSTVAATAGAPSSFSATKSSVAIVVAALLSTLLL